jgi:predicted small secreted protein
VKRLAPLVALLLLAGTTLIGCPGNSSSGHGPGDGHDHGTSPVHSEGDGHDHDKGKAKGHDEGDGHDHKH